MTPAIASFGQYVRHFPTVWVQLSCYDTPDIIVRPLNFSSHRNTDGLVHPWQSFALWGPFSEGPPSMTEPILKVSLRNVFQECLVSRDQGTCSRQSADSSGSVLITRKSASQVFSKSHKADLSLILRGTMALHQSTHPLCILLPINPPLLSTYLREVTQVICTTS